jgi:hypothetical protein
MYFHEQIFFTNPQSNATSSHVTTESHYHRNLWSTRSRDNVPSFCNGESLLLHRNLWLTLLSFLKNKITIDLDSIRFINPSTYILSLVYRNTPKILIIIFALGNNQHIFDSIVLFYFQMHEVVLAIHHYVS